MDYDRIILELLDRIQVLEQKVKTIENNMEHKALSLKSSQSINKKISVKYRALSQYLLDTRQNEVVLTYNEIEKILGFKLPSSAFNHPHQFWANTYTHSFATSWLVIGFKTKLDNETNQVTFIKDII